jgi:hypothetical protein
VGRLMAEMGIIVFSVLLALAVNEWRQAAARRAAVDTVLEMVRSEATRNRAEVARALTHHQGLLDQLRAGGIVMARVPLGIVPLDTTSAPAVARSLNAILQEEAAGQGRPLPPPFQATRLPDGHWFLQSEEGSIRLEIHGDTAVVRGTGNITLSPPFLVEAAWEAAQVTQAALHMDPEIVEAMARIRQLHRNVEAVVSRLVDMLYGASSRSEPVSALSDLASFEALLVDAYDELLERLP